MKRRFDLSLSALCAACLAAAPLSAQEQTREPVQWEFGSNASEWSHDGECDDPRFTGKGMAAALVTDNIGRDASDCRKAFDSDQIALHPMFAEPSDTASIDYGDNRSTFANDGACDDIRFTGDYASEMVYLVDDIGHDASDCRAAVKSGEARWQGGKVNLEHGVTIDDIIGEEAGASDNTG
ncbi:hypothetical protein [Qipengyuania sp. DGS5-3]|uniref:hypothetical protein n=1 Tax=Qipengyuania sp. DGS5-3 TaxID=3349632 RepID=UPI0036D42EC5